HRFCCTVEASQEVLYQEYLGATRFGIEQPGAHRRRQDAGIRGDCRLRRPPSGDAASRRGWFRKGCGQLTAQQLEELRQDSPPEPGDHESPPSVS
ncbi:MAG TPA: hypothetical protein VFY90_05870, partial [Tepidiformaceae bacterium]|nr:hypothetical protein [Tepidiformaceae bacterium]